MKNFGALLALGLATAAEAMTGKPIYNVHVRDANGESLPSEVREIEAPGHTSKLASRSVEYTYNWCGAIHTSPSSGNFSAVTGEWSVPNVSVPSGGSASTDYWLYQWIGIDGYSCDVILQAGTGITFQNNVANHFVWWEFYPGGVVTVDMSINAGDTIFLEVQATSTTTGTVYFENLSNGASTSVTADANGAGTLCLQNAEWITEDPEELPFPVFTSFDFNACGASTSTGATMDLDGALFLDIVQSGTDALLCQASQMSSSEMSNIYG